MMQDHLDRIRRETVAVRSQVDKARRVLEGLGSLTVPEGPPAGPVPDKNKRPGNYWGAARTERDVELWASADALLA